MPLTPNNNSIVDLIYYKQLLSLIFTTMYWLYAVPLLCHNL